MGCCLRFECHPIVGKPSLDMGVAMATEAVTARVKLDALIDMLSAHVSGDWGVVSPQNRAENDALVQSGADGKITSAYALDERAAFDPIGNLVLVVTMRGAGEVYTLILLPSELDELELHFGVVN